MEDGSHGIRSSLPDMSEVVKQRNEQQQEAINAPALKTPRNNPTLPINNNNNGTNQAKAQSTGTKSGGETVYIESATGAFQKVKRDQLMKGKGTEGSIPTGSNFASYVQKFKVLFLNIILFVAGLLGGIAFLQLLLLKTTKDTSWYCSVTASMQRLFFFCNGLAFIHSLFRVLTTPTGVKGSPVRSRFIFLIIIAIVNAIGFICTTIATKYDEKIYFYYQNNPTVCDLDLILGTDSKTWFGANVSRLVTALVSWFLSVVEFHVYKGIV